MAYTVIKPFMDLQDNKHVYKVGDAFPHPGYKASEDRLRELSTTENKKGKVFIKSDKPVEKKTLSKTEIMRMNVAQLRKLAAEHGLENPEEMIGSELKEWLVANAR